MNAERQRMTAVLRALSRTRGSTMLARLGQGKPFHTLVATMLSARTRDEVTETVAAELLRQYPDPGTLAAARPERLWPLLRRVGLYRAKSRNLVAMSRELLSRHGGKVPDRMQDLTALSGVGRKTAGCVLVYAFGKSALPVDTHVHRISNRLGVVHTRTPEQTEQALLEIVPRRYVPWVNDLFVHHGKTVCLPQRPRCAQCPVRRHCDFAMLNGFTKTTDNDRGSRHG
ncbi:MAG: endonuclease III [Myxococcales bacterium]|nr:endonuclease III [Myxococcales bacterium]